MRIVVLVTKHEQPFRPQGIARTTIAAHPLERIIEPPAHRLHRDTAKDGSLNLPA